MSRKNDTKVSEAERTQLAAAEDAFLKASNAKRRADIALANAEQDRAEVHQGLAKRYKLNEGDIVNSATGEIVRKGGGN